MGIHVHKRKAGPHGKNEKAVRRQQNIATQREAGRVARHLAFNQSQDGFESLASHHDDKRMAAAEALTAGTFEQMRIPRERVANRHREVAASRLSLSFHEAAFAPRCPELVMAPAVNRRARKRTQVRALPAEQMLFFAV